ncbi:heme exporter protein CcmD [Rhodoligotrophos appendicifer]|uniref:heme exporter protein CcmD n=1 Tax=Rhodoligotrophos appendicifer TaxID=987056 RepID=UPI0011871628|nr:heme exporter protein CcmD [Rhodoligotrophos appendicifer]
MSFEAPHVAFVVAAYVLTALVLAAMTVGIIIAYRRQARRLQELEERGAPRRPIRSQAMGQET